MNKQIISVMLIFLLIFTAISANVVYAVETVEFSFELSKDSFNVNEEIKGSGIVKIDGLPANGESVAFTVEDESGLSVLKVGQPTTDREGKFDVSFRLPYNLNTGKYFIRMKALGKSLEKSFDYVKHSDGGSGGSSNLSNPTTPPASGEKIVLNLDPGSATVTIGQDVIKSIIENKKDLIITSKDFNLTISPDTFEGIKDTVTVSAAKKDDVNKGDYTQISPVIEISLSVKKGDTVESLKLGEKTILSFKYDDKSGLNYEKAGIYKVDKQGNLTFIGGKLNRGNKTIDCEVDSLGIFVVLIYNKTFKDVDMEWARNPIEVLASRNIINGVDNENFRPYQNITRAEFCKMLVSTLDVKAKGDTSKFSDVSSDKWYYNYVNAAAELGLVQGYNGMFNPDDLITREAMVVMIQRAAKLEKYGASASGSLNFSDAGDISDWAEDAVLFAKSNGIVQGTGENAFEPKRNATRAETAVMIYKTLKLKDVF